MDTTPLSPNETQRLEKLKSYDILDSESEAMFDEITRLASELLNVPIVLVSLIDEDRQWFKSKVGLEVDQTARNISFCQHAILEEDIFEVENAMDDPRFQENPLVKGAPDIRFYAGAPLRDSEGLNLGTLCVIDRSPRQLSERDRSILDTLSRTVVRMIELRKSNLDMDVYRKFFQMNLNILCVVGLDGHFKLINPAFTSVLGWSEEELMSRRFISFIHPDDRDRTKKAITELVSGKNLIGYECRFETKSGEYLRYRWTSSRDESTNDMFAVAHDVTELIETQENLISAVAETKRLSQVKEEFFSNMSHEIRTPLNAIIGFTDLLSRSELSKEQTQYVQTVSVASENLTVLVNDILDISKMESGKLTLEERIFSIKDTVEHVVQLQGAKAKSKGIKIISSIDNEIPDYVIGDETRLTQILVNITGNALKFTEKGYVEIKAFEVGHSDGKATVSFQVKDTGIGIAKDKVDSIFDRFTQAQSSTTRLYGGTGLGLSIVKMLVDLQQGELSVKSTLGEGSEFTVQLSYPIGKPEKGYSNHHKRRVSSADLLAGMKVLIVEDNEHNQVLASTYLTRNQAEVEIAENGAEALAALQNDSFDLILMDLQMPVMDGFQATAAIRNELGLTIPIVACSAHSLIGERDKCLELGMDEYVPKPYSEVQLLNVILEFWAQNRIPSAPISYFNEDVVSILNASKEEEGSDLVNALVQILLKRSFKDIEILETALKQGDFESIAKRSHLISGSMASLGFEEGFSIAKKTEAAANSADQDSVKQLGKQLVDYIHYITDSIEKEYTYA